MPKQAARRAAAVQQMRVARVQVLPAAGGGAADRQRRGQLHAVRQRGHAAEYLESPQYQV